ncbi:hypothetical protein DL93DRAFT_1762916 [Clavulina sp. PMI_390]|nr:hypothetical protein DL93DRAFT_1762916 [Clavulina sp. PMI_390]
MGKELGSAAESLHCPISSPCLIYRIADGLSTRSWGSGVQQLGRWTIFKFSQSPCLVRSNTALIRSQPNSLLSAPRTKFGMNDEVHLNWQQPAVSLLPEILSQIFISTLRGFGHVDPQHISSENVHSMRQTRLTLCAVCSRWRQVSLCTQLLWSIISFPSDYDGDVYTTTTTPWSGETSASVIIFNEEIKRSGQCPLSLYLMTAARDPWERRPWPLPMFYHELVTTIKPLLIRCRHLHFWGDKELFFRLISHLDSSPTPYLQSISTSLQPDLSNPQERIIDLSQAHRISEVRVHSDYDEEDSNPAAIPLQLKLSAEYLPRRVDIDVAVNHQNIMALFTQSSSLEEFYWISSDRRFELPRTPLPPVPHLRHLILFARVPPTLLERLDAPALARLETRFPWEPDEVFPLPLSSSRSFPNLRALVLGGHRGTMHEHELIIIGFIQSHPSLQIVGLPGHITEGVVEALATLPSLGHVSATLEFHASETTGLNSLLRRWQTAAIANGSGSSHLSRPTLYIEGPFGISREAVSLVEEDGLLAFAKQRILDYPPFLHGQTSGAYWDEIISKVERGEGLRRVQAL